MHAQISLRAHISNERGIALISSLLITLLMTLVVIALAYRVQMFSVGTRENIVKSQNTYTADIGLNQARYFFLDKECRPSTTNLQWHCGGDGTDIGSTFTEISNKFVNTYTQAITFTVAGQTFTYQPTASFTGASGETHSYKVYAKINSQLIINVVAVAERTGNTAQTVIDAGLLFDSHATADGNYAQKGQGADNAGKTKETLGDGIASSTVQSSF